MIDSPIDTKLADFLRLSVSMINFGNQTETVIPTEHTHEYLLNHFNVCSEILDYYYLPTYNLISDTEYEGLINTGLITDRRRLLKPYPFVYKGCYISRCDLYIKVSTFQLHKDATYKNKSLTIFKDLLLYYDDYHHGFVEGYNNFEKDCIEIFSLKFSSKEDFIEKIYEFVTKEIVFTHSWINNHRGFTYSIKQGKTLYNGEIIKAFDNGLEQGRFYKAWSLILSNSKSFEILFKEKGQKKSTFILNDLLGCCCKLIENKHFYFCDEDTRTKQILDLLSLKYYTKDQSSYGISETGIKPGKIDGVVTHEDTEYFIEAFNLCKLDKTYITRHIHKLEQNYDSKGIKEKFSLIYLNTDKFESLFSKIVKYLTIELQYKFIIGSYELIDTKYTNIRVLKTIHRREGFNCVIYHIIMKFPKS